MNFKKGTPEGIRSDNGLEFTSEAAQASAKEQGIRWHFIQPGCPAQNAYVERFNGTYCSEILDLHRFRSLDEARIATAHWLTVYNGQRTHSAIGHLPPRAFKQRWPHQQSLLSSGTG